MNTPKYNIEQQIKKQIDERELNPTRDLWAEIESQTLNQPSKKLKINWFLVAASLALLVSLGIVFSNNNDDVEQPQIVETKTQPENLKPEKSIETEVTPLLAEKKETVSTKNHDTVLPPENKISKAEVVATKTELPLIKVKQDQIIPEDYHNQISTSIATVDSTKGAVKRKRYVDASTLLFSVEHKDVIENSKDGSNVATIDLNSK